MIRSVLVANRGEIARRVIATCRALDIATVAVFSDADASALHVAEADRAVRLPGDAARETYLRGDLIIEAARRAGADAVHPGYGFLSENADFARAVVTAGLVWVGPPAEAIAAMGSKVAAKRLMADAGVPVLPELDVDALTADQLPVLLKASAGGGGRGMRVVAHLDRLAAEVAAARDEAAAAFGDPTVFAEPYLPAGHHIEVQILADRHATVWAVGERECSVQRRHQKVVEEAPAPLVERTPGMRARLFDAAVAAARAVGYVGAGTVEFLADGSGDFHFLEMNTRLQVEHPVTECTTGLDLVALQLAVADAQRLPAAPPDTRGHAIEARLYAEDPAAGWAPQTGTLSRVDVGHDVGFAAGTAPAGIRLDTGVRSGDRVSTHYDPMLAKVIAWAPSRDEARRRLAAALDRARVRGLRTNRTLLVNVLRHEAFATGHTDTAFFDRHGVAALSATEVDDPELLALAADLAWEAATKAESPVQQGIPLGWRNVPSERPSTSYELAGTPITSTWRRDRDRVGLGDRTVDVIRADATAVVLDADGIRRRYGVEIDGDTVHVEGIALHRAPRFADPAGDVAPGSLIAPMPGTVVAVHVGVGDTVEAGAALLRLEAMKMQHEVHAPVAGVVGELNVSVNQQIEVGTVLAVVTEGEMP